MILLLSLASFAAGPIAVPGSTVTVRAETTDEQAAGFPILVPVRVENTGTSPATFPDLGARPWLVHFATRSPEGKKAERRTTPPSVDPGTTWTIPPRGARTVLLEVPSSQGFGNGTWELGIRLESPTLDLGTRTVSVATPNPVAGVPVWEPTIAHAVGATLPWVHQGARAAQLYLMQWAGGGKFEAQYPIAALPSVVEPILSRSRAPDARTRWTYWIEGRSLRRVRLQGTAISDETMTLPYKDVSPLGRGVTTADGSLMAPIWVPGPAGRGGAARLLVIDERGGVSARLMTDLPARPAVVQTGVDASGGMLLLLGHADGLDLYRASPTDPAALPVKGVRVVRTLPGMETVAATFVTLPDAAGRAGGVSVFALVAGTAFDGRRWVTRLLADVNGTIFDRAPLVPWTIAAPVQDVLATGYGGWAVVARSESGAWYATDRDVPRPIEVPRTGSLSLFGGASTRLRWLGGPGVFTELPLGPPLEEPVPAAPSP